MKNKVSNNIYNSVIGLSKKISEVFFNEHEVEFFDINSISPFGIRVLLENQYLKVDFTLVHKKTYPDICNMLYIEKNQNYVLICNLNEYCHDLYFNTSLYEDIPVPHKKIQEIIDTVLKLDTPDYHHDLYIKNIGDTQ